MAEERTWASVRALYASAFRDLWAAIKHKLAWELTAIAFRIDPSIADDIVDITKREIVKAEIQRLRKEWE